MIPYKPTKKTKNLFINWLAQEYEINEAKRQINNAKFFKNNSFIFIQYSNKVTDKIKIYKNRIIHLNPFKI